MGLLTKPVAEGGERRRADNPCSTAGSHKRRAGRALARSSGPGQEGLWGVKQPHAARAPSPRLLPASLLRSLGTRTVKTFFLVSSAKPPPRSRGEQRALPTAPPAPPNPAEPRDSPPEGRKTRHCRGDRGAQVTPGGLASGRCPARATFPPGLPFGGVSSFLCLGLKMASAHPWSPLSRGRGRPLAASRFCDASTQTAPRCFSARFPRCDTNQASSAEFQKRGEAGCLRDSWSYHLWGKAPANSPCERLCRERGALRTPRPRGRSGASRDPFSPLLARRRPLSARCRLLRGEPGPGTRPLPPPPPSTGNPPRETSSVTRFRSPPARLTSGPRPRRSPRSLAAATAAVNDFETWLPRSNPPISGARPRRLGQPPPGGGERPGPPDENNPPPPLSPEASRER